MRPVDVTGKKQDMDRRYFLKTSGIGLASFGFMAAAPDFLHQFAGAQAVKNGYGKKKVLVTFSSAEPLMG